jgi:hypothetical protein
MMTEEFTTTVMTENQQWIDWKLRTTRLLILLCSMSSWKLMFILRMKWQ